MITSRLLKRMLPGVILIIAAFVLSYQGYDAGFLAIGGAVAIGTVLFIRWRAGGELEKDERTKKLGAFSLAYSYLVSLILALALFVAVFLGMVDIDAIVALQIVIYAMTGSAIVFMLTMNRRADVWES
jgi:hypothetical protein